MSTYYYFLDILTSSTFNSSDNIAISSLASLIFYNPILKFFSASSNSSYLIWYRVLNDFKKERYILGVTNTYLLIF